MYTSHTGRLVTKLSALFLGVALVSCSYRKEFVPLRLEPVAVGVPNGIRPVALSIESAVEALKWPDLRGKSVVLEINTLFPSPRESCTAYVRGATMGALARAGADVVPPGGESKAHFRVLLELSYCGIDTQTSTSLRVVPVIVESLIATAGLVLGGIGYAKSRTPAEYVGSTALVLGGPALALGAAYLVPPVKTTVEVIGRARLVADGLPSQGEVAFHTVGEGTSTVVVDETEWSGYTLRPSHDDTTK